MGERPKIVLDDATRYLMVTYKSTSEGKSPVKEGERLPVVVKPDDKTEVEATVAQFDAQRQGTVEWLDHEGAGGAYVDVPEEYQEPHL